MAQKLTARTLLRQERGVVNDTIVPGLRFVIAKRSRSFRMSPRINGEQKNLKVYTVTAASLKEAGAQLADARKAARQILEDAAKGVDPGGRQRAEKRKALKATRTTFGSVAERYMLEEGRHKKDAKERQRKLDKEILPSLGDIPVAEIERHDVKELLLRKFETFPVEARRLHALVRRILFYAQDEGLVDANVAARIKLGEETPRDRYLNRDEIRTFWNGLDTAAMSEPVKRILKLLLVTGQRRGEVTNMTWPELHLDEGYWEIPAARTKAGRPHRVPLSPLALELIGEQGDGEYVFAKANGKPPIVNSVSQAMLQELPVLGLDDRAATPHDLRRTAATGWGDLGIQPYVVSRLLNHALAGVTDRVYLLSAFAEQKRIAMQAWSDRLIEITSGQPMPDKVSRLRA